MSATDVVTVAFLVVVGAVAAWAAWWRVADRVEPYTATTETDESWLAELPVRRDI